jgi:prohibitin 2
MGKLGTSTLLGLILILAGCGFEQVDEGFRGIEQRFGKVVGEPLSPGLHFYNPVTSGITEISVREQKIDAVTECFTSDTQKVAVSYVVTFYPDQSKIGAIYSQFGKEWQEKIVSQVILGSIKDVVGHYRADDLVSKREDARKAAENELKTSLATRSVIVTKLDFTNLDFDDAYEKAVEAKVVAVQKAAEAKNHTVEIEEKAKQTVATAQADAEAMKIKTQALAQSHGLVEYEAIKRWDGKLPEIMFGSSVPMINLDSLRKAK